MESSPKEEYSYAPHTSPAPEPPTPNAQLTGFQANTRRQELIKKILSSNDMVCMWENEKRDGKGYYYRIVQELNFKTLERLEVFSTDYSSMEKEIIPAAEGWK